jgi:mannose PTS system EIID component
VKPRLATALLRLFTVQGSWNYERMIGVGTGVAEEPLLRDLPGGPGGQEYRDAVARATRFFNAHPYLVGLAVGAAARAEHEGVPPDQIERLRAALTGPLGSVGDRLVWAGWLPLTAGLAVAGVGLGLGWRAVLGFLILYNVGHVALRAWALRQGWRHGARVVLALQSPWLQRATVLAGPGMALGLGFAMPLAAVWLAGAFAPWARLVLAGCMAAGLVLLRLFPRQITGLRLGLGFVAIALIAGSLWR